LDAFREIVPPPQMTRLPGASDAVCGLINLRGTIVTVIDGGRALDLQPFVRDEGLILIVDYFDRWIGIGVDDVRDIQDVPIDQFVSTDGSELPVPGVVTAVVELEGKRVIVLDIKTVIQQVIGQGR
jgi:purine-binding chemotaxis protein CheW